MSTIVAISTAPGNAGIGIVRLSGEDSLNIVKKIFKPAKEGEIKGYTIKYGNIIDSENQIIDEVLVSFFIAPKSYTGENMCEINSHGNNIVLKKILELCIENGANLAEAGEFTKRAFLNGRIDLTKATAVQDLINVKSENARKIAMANLTGKTNTTIKNLRQKLREIISNIEVNIDYPEYLDIEVMTKEKIEESLDYIKESLEKIIINSKNSKIIKEGINVAIVGRPNVGKSSILNRLLKEEKAIVTDIAGTTRDIVEGSCVIDGIQLNFIDTAGIRETTDVVEKIGVDRSLETIKDANLVILVLNNNEELTKEDLDLLEKTKDKKRIIVVNKNDLDKKLDIDYDVIYTNTLTDEGIDSLIFEIKKLFNLEELDMDDFTYVSSIEQVKKLEEAKNSLEEIEKGLKNDLPIDMLEIDIKNIWTILGEIIGETYTEELLDNLFKDFCVGK